MYSMTKHLGEDGIEYVDGRPVELYEAKIINAVPMNPEDAVGLSDGDEIVLQVVVRVETPKFVSNKKSGQLKRQNQFRIHEIIVMDTDEAKIEKPAATYVQLTKIEDLGFDPKDGEV